MQYVSSVCFSQGVLSSPKCQTHNLNAMHTNTRMLDSRAVAFCTVHETEICRCVSGAAADGRWRNGRV